MEDIQTIDLIQEIRTRYGSVNRAAGPHLYTAKGKRLLDLYQEGGAAILGWRAGRAKLMFKNILDRGLTGSFPTDAEARLVRAVQAHLPEYEAVRWYATKEKARLACGKFLDLWSDIPLIESPFLHPEASIDIGPPGDSPLSAAKNLHGVTLWRPWLDEAYYSMGERVDASFLASANTAVNAQVVCSPFPWAGAPVIAVFSTDPQERVAPSDPISPALLAAMARSFADLSAAQYQRSEADWARFDKQVEPWWERRGPYLVPKMRKSRYNEFFGRALDAGILISPVYESPSIVPYKADSGEFKGLNP